MSGRFGHGVTRIILVAALAACATPAVPAPAPASGVGAAPTAATGQPAPSPTQPAARIEPLTPPLTVVVGSSTADLAYGSIVARERGYHREVGIEIDFKGRVGDSAAAMTAAAANTLDIAHAATGPALFNAAARGIRLMVVAAELEAIPGDKSTCWVARKDLVESGQVKTPADFRGLRVAGQAQGVGSSNDVYLARTLAPFGMTFADVEEIPMEFGSINQAMGNKAIDIGWQLEPLTTLGIENGLYERIACTGDIYPGYQGTFVFYSPQFAENTQAARNFIYGYLRGIRDYADAMFRDQGKDVMIEMLRNNTAVKDRAIWDKMPARWFSPTGRINTSVLASDQEFYVQRGFLGQTVDPGTFVNTSFVDFANAVLGEYTFRP